MNVLWAYTVYQVKRYIRTPITLLWLLVLPAGLLVMLGGARINIFASSTTVGNRPGNGFPYADFLVTGLIGLSSVSSGLFGLGVVLVQAREQGILQRLASTPQPAWKFVTGQVLASGAMAILVTALLLALGRLLFGVSLPRRLGEWCLVLSLGTATFLTMGYALAAAMHEVRTAQIVGNMVFWLCLFLGDVWFPLSALPAHFQQLGQMLPLAHFLSTLRAVGLAGQPLTAHLGSLAILGLWGGIAAAAAMWQFRSHREW
jgi:ABC-2 type transport system permease protein